MATEKYTFKQFQAQYLDDDVCMRSIFNRKFGETKYCLSCGVESKLVKIEGRRAYACQGGCHVYPCASTIFAKSSTYLMTATRNGVSAKELQRQLGVTDKCAFRMGHQLRDLMAARAAAQGPRQLSGHVEVDETYVGGYQKRTKKGQPTNKTIVMGMIERGGTFRSEVIPAATAKRLVPRILENVAPGSIVNTDSLRRYRTLGKKGFEHVAVNHEIEQWAIGIHHTNTIEGFWKPLKNGICSTHVSVSPRYLGNYVNEFGFRFDNRQAPARMFGRLLNQISRV